MNIWPLNTLRYPEMSEQKVITLASNDLEVIKKANAEQEKAVYAAIRRHVERKAVQKKRTAAKWDAWKQREAMVESANLSSAKWSAWQASRC